MRLSFLVVTLVFGIIFWLTGVPLYLAFMFGGIALAITYGRVIRCVWEWKPGFRR